MSLARVHGLRSLRRFSMVLCFEVATVVLFVSVVFTHIVATPESEIINRFQSIEEMLSLVVGFQWSCGSTLQESNGVVF